MLRRLRSGGTPPSLIHPYQTRKILRHYKCRHGNLKTVLSQHGPGTSFPISLLTLQTLDVRGLGGPIPVVRKGIWEARPRHLGSQSKGKGTVGFSLINTKRKTNFRVTVYLNNYLNEFDDASQTRGSGDLKIRSPRGYS